MPYVRQKQMALTSGKKEEEESSPQANGVSHLVDSFINHIATINSIP